MPTLQPETLFHWSKKPLDVFLNNAPRFKVYSQGRAWFIDRIGSTKGATSRPKALSLVVFRGQAADLFVKHPQFSWLGWKRWFGQYWSKEVHQDIVWNASDAFHCGRVLVVRKATFADIDDPIRLRDQIKKRRRIIAGEIAGYVMVVIVFILAFLAHNVFATTIQTWIQGILPEVSPQTSDIIAQAIPYIFAGALILFFGPIPFMKVIRVPNADGTPWDVDAELAGATAKADNAREMEEQRALREQ
jgi:hypothetical protein